MISVYFLAGTICCKTVRPSVVPTQPPFQLITWVLSTQVKQPTRVVILLTIFRTEVKMEFSSTSPICPYGVDRNNFAVYYHSLNSRVLSLNCYLGSQSPTLYLNVQNHGHI